MFHCLGANIFHGNIVLDPIAGRRAQPPRVFMGAATTRRRCFARVAGLVLPLHSRVVMGAQPPRVVMEAGSNDTKRPLHELKPQLRQGRRGRSGDDHPTELTAAAPAPVVVTNPTDLTAAAPPLTNAAQQTRKFQGRLSWRPTWPRPPSRMRQLRAAAIARLAESVTNSAEYATTRSSDTTRLDI